MISASKKLTKKTLYVMVTCSKDESRHACLVKTIDSLKETGFLQNYADNIIVFDNDSTNESTLGLLKKNFKHVFKSSKNVGYFTAIKWAIDNYRDILGKDLDYIHPIESDCIYYDIEKLHYAEQFLDKYLEAGSVRCQEFSVENCHLYDKDINNSLSKRHAWVRQTNYFTKLRVQFQKTEVPYIYLNNFVTLVCCLNRISTMKSVMSELAAFDTFTELDFQASFYKYFKLCGCIDGGVFTSVGSDGVVISGSLLGTQTKEQLEQLGYLTTRDGIKIIDNKSFEVFRQ